MTDRTVKQIAACLGAAHADILNRLTNGQRLLPASRAQDSLRRTLRQRGLIAHCGKPKRWQISALGIAVRHHLQKEQGE